MRNRANNAVVVAGGLKKYRDSASHDDGVQHGFVTIAVNHHHIAWCNRVVPHHFVAGAGAVGYKKAMVSIKNTRRIALTFGNWAGMVKQLAQLFNRITDIGAQHVFAKKLVKHLTYW